MNSTESFIHADADQVTDRLFVGGDLGAGRLEIARGLRELQAAGVTHIIDTRSEWSDEDVAAQFTPGLTYTWVGIDDLDQQVPGEWFAEIVDLINDALADPAGKVFIHCHMGVNRSPSAVVAYLLSQGETITAALDAVRAARSTAYAAYAEDALDWWLAESGADATAARAATEALAQWRANDDLDVDQVIHAMRVSEGGVDDPAEEHVDGACGGVWILSVDDLEADQLTRAWTADPLAQVMTPVPDRATTRPGPGDAVYLWRNGAGAMPSGLIGIGTAGEITDPSDAILVLDCEVLAAPVLIDRIDLPREASGLASSMRRAVLRRLIAEEQDVLGEAWTREITAAADILQQVAGGLTPLPPVGRFEGSKAWLLTWNPRKFMALPWMRECLRRQAAQDPLGVFTWSTGGRRQGMAPGDRVYLLKQGEEPRGLVAVGQVAGDGRIHVGPHWRGSDYGTTGYVQVSWDRMVHDLDPLPLSVLQAVAPEVRWRTQSGGIAVPSEAIGAIETAWAEHMSSSGSLLGTFARVSGVLNQRQREIDDLPAGVDKDLEQNWFDAAKALS